MALRIRRIDCASDDAERAIAELRDELSPEGNVVSPEGPRADDRGVRRAAEPRQVVERICDDVPRAGSTPCSTTAAGSTAPCSSRAGSGSRPTSWRDAHRRADPAYLETIGRVRDNILAFQRASSTATSGSERGPGIELGLLYRPLRRVGVCIPGGAAAYPSSC